MAKNRAYLRSLPTNVYRAYDAHGDLLYVGISSRLLVRLNEHRVVSQWFEQATSFSIECYSDQKQARGAEADAIAEEMPLWNARPEALARRIRAQAVPYEPFDSYEIDASDIWPTGGEENALVQD